MIVVWDEPKRRANLEKHGLDFADVEATFSWSRVLAFPAKPSRTGRLRLKLVGMLGHTDTVVAIVSPLGSEALAIVSLRTASPVERTSYEQA